MQKWKKNIYIKHVYEYYTRIERQIGRDTSWHAIRDDKNGHKTGQRIADLYTSHDHKHTPIKAKRNNNNNISSNSNSQPSCKLTIFRVKSRASFE